MDLISREEVRRLIWRNNDKYGYSDRFHEFTDEVLNNLPSAFEGMTNGEVLESVFPNVVIDRISDTCSVAAIRIGTEEIVSCYKKWLDSPYKGVNE